MMCRYVPLALGVLAAAGVAPVHAQTPGSALDEAWVLVCAGAEPGTAFFERCQEIIAAGPGSGDRRSAAASGNNLGTYAAQSGNAGERSVQAADDEVSFRDVAGRLGWFVSAGFGETRRSRSEFENGFKADLRRVNLGLDLRLSENSLIGVVAGQLNSDRRFRDGAGKADTRQRSLIGFFDWHDGNRLAANAYLGAADLDHDLRRNISYELVLNAGEPEQSTVIIEDQARASPGGSQVLGGASFTWDFSSGAFGRGLRAGTDYSRTRVDSFTETGGGGLAFSAERLQETSWSGRVGLDLSYSISTDWGVVVPYARLDMVREFKRDDQDLVVRFAGDATGTPIVFGQESQDRNFGQIAAGISAVYPAGVSLFAEIEALVGHSQLDHYLVTAGLRVQR